jgi:AraC-like DNA-binding protein
MVKTGHATIRRVRFTPPTQSVGGVEVNTLRGIRDRGGPHEFRTLQRLDFDLLVHIETGSAVHTVDFTDHPLLPGDILWVRAGQVHRWGAIAAIEGDVVMFDPHSIGSPTSDLIKAQLLGLRNRWSAADLADGRAVQTLELLAASSGSPELDRSDLRRAAREHLLATLLIELTLLQPVGRTPAQGPTNEVLSWFRDHIEEHFQEWHKVSDYADRLGYSSRTLNRLARRHTGLTAKELIDERVILEAKRRLSHLDAPIAEIADHLGFDDASNFSSYFRRHTQMTPGSFRIQSRTIRSTRSAH